MRIRNKSRKIIIDSAIAISVNISSVCKYNTKMVIYKVFKETEK